MKKILEKIVTITLAFIGLLFVVLMLVLMFKPEYAENLNNQLVHVLIIIFSAMFAILTALNIATAFSDSDKINNVLLFKTRTSATKASIGVVKRTAKKAISKIEGAKMKKVTLFVDENNDVRLKVDIKVFSEDVESLLVRVRAVLVHTFEEVLGLVFSSVDFNVVKVKNEFEPDSEKIDQAVAEFKAEQEVQKAEKGRRLAEEAAAREAEEAAAKEAEEYVAKDEADQVETAAEVVASEDEEIEVEFSNEDETDDESDDTLESVDSEEEEKPFAEENIGEIVSDIPSEVVDNIIDPLDGDKE